MGTHPIFESDFDCLTDFILKMAPKGQTVEQKRAKALTWFKKQKTFFHMKELEKEMSKAVGVHPMAIKDIVKDLREENLIEEEKIGASSFYWCLESKIMNNLVAKEKKLQSDIDMLDKEIGIQNQLYEDFVANGKALPTPSDIAQEAQAQKKIENEIKELKIQIAKMRENTPEFALKVEECLVEYKEGANRWTDNIFNVISWVKKRFPHLDPEAMFKIPDTFDYVE